MTVSDGDVKNGLVRGMMTMAVPPINAGGKSGRVDSIKLRAWHPSHTFKLLISAKASPIGGFTQSLAPLTRRRHNLHFLFQ
jgi:hypothetical protein